MTAKIVQFSKRIPEKKSDSEGTQLKPPPVEDLKGFINTLNFLAQQSSTQAIDVSVFADEMSISIYHHDDLDETGGVIVSASSTELMTTGPFTPEDHTTQIANLLEMFNRIDADKYGLFETEPTQDETK